MSYLNHVTLSTGHNRRSPRSEVGPHVIAWLRPWVDKLLSAGAILPLPEPSLARYSASAHTEQGGLVMTVYAGADALVTMAVAERSRQSAQLWAYMQAQHGPVAAGIATPDAPWLAVALRLGLGQHMDANRWLGDFERCIAWAWITRNPDLRPVA